MWISKINISLWRTNIRACIMIVFGTCLRKDVLKSCFNSSPKCYHIHTTRPLYQTAVILQSVLFFFTDRLEYTYQIWDAKIVIMTHEAPKMTTVKQSLYHIAQALRVPEESVSQISRHSAHEGGKVVSSTHRPQGNSTAIRIIWMKNSNDTIENFFYY